MQPNWTCFPSKHISAYIYILNYIQLRMYFTKQQLHIPVVIITQIHSQYQWQHRGNKSLFCWLQEVMYHSLCDCKSFEAKENEFSKSGRRRIEPLTFSWSIVAVSNSDEQKQIEIFPPMISQSHSDRYAHMHHIRYNIHECSPLGESSRNHSQRHL